MSGDQVLMQVHFQKFAEKALHQKNCTLNEDGSVMIGNLSARRLFRKQSSTVYMGRKLERDFFFFLIQSLTLLLLGLLYSVITQFWFSETQN